MRDNASSLDSFICYNLALGFSMLFLYADDPEDDWGPEDLNDLLKELEDEFIEEELDELDELSVNKDDD